MEQTHCCARTYSSLGAVVTVPLTYTHSTGIVRVILVAVVVVAVEVVVDVVIVAVAVLKGNPPPPPPPAEADAAVEENVVPATVTTSGSFVMELAVASSALCEMESGANVIVIRIDPDARTVLTTSAAVRPALVSI